MKMRIPKDGINSLTAIFHEDIVAESFLQKAEPDNTNISILKKE